MSKRYPARRLRLIAAPVVLMAMLWQYAGPATWTPSVSVAGAARAAGIPTKGRTANGCTITTVQAAAEQRVVSLVNRHRRAVRVRLLTLNPALSLASREHSCEMLKLQSLQHESTDGSSPFTRFKRHGIQFMTAGENVGDSTGYSAMAGVDKLDADMMAEPSTEGTHHWNIIHAAYSGIGIGIIYAKGQLWLTEDFVG